MQRIGGYEVLGEIARGSLGVVFRARDPRTQGEVALKLLLAAQSTPQARRRFEREAGALLRLDHPNLVKLLDVGAHQGRPYLVTELVQGSSAQDHLDRHGALDVDDAVRMARDLTRGVAHAHANEILHRDVKPANVLLTTSGGVRLTDFGLAKDLGASTSHLSKSGHYLGSPGFWPPEQAQGALERMGPRSDVYSIGATLYAFLVQEPPFVAGSLVENLHQTMHERPQPPSRKRPEVDARLDAICLRCLAKDPAERYGSVEELGQALDDYLRGAPQPSGDRRLIQALVAAVVVLALGLGLTTVSVLNRPAASAGATETRRAEIPPEKSAAPAPPAVAHKTTALAPRAEQPGPRTSAEWLERAVSLRQQKKVEAAAEAYGKALDLDPQNVDILTRRGTMLAMAGDTSGAIQDFRAFLVKAPGHAMTRQVRGYLRKLEAKLQPGRPARPSLAQHGKTPSDAQAWLRLAGKMERQRNLRGAVEAYSRAIRANPKLARAYSLRGTVKYRLRDYAGAMADYRAFLQLEPNSPHAGMMRRQMKLLEQRARERK